MKTWVLASVAALSAVGLLILRKGTTRRRPAEPRVLLIGDSHAQGLAPHLGRMASAAGVPFGADFQVGSTVALWATPRLQAALDAHQPTVVLVSLGNNESATMQAATPAVKAGVQAVADMVHAAGADLAYLVSPRLPWSTAWAATLWRAAADDAMPGLAFDDEPRGDNIHLLPAGYSRWATAIWQWLETRRFR